MDKKEFEAIKVRAQAIRRVIQAADEAQTIEVYESKAVLLLIGVRRADDDLLALIQEVERLRPDLTSAT